MFTKPTEPIKLVSRMTKQSDAADTIAKEIQKIIDYIRDCEVRAARGEVLELQGLDQNVLIICNKITGLDIPHSKTVEPLMTSLIEALDNLASTLKTQQDHIIASSG